MSRLGTRFAPGVAGHTTPVIRAKIVYWSLVAVLVALAFFLVAAGARVLRGRREGPAGGG